MAYEITMLEGYGTPRFNRSTNKKESQMKLGTAARACKGKKKGAFRACVRRKMRGGRRHGRRSRR